MATIFQEARVLEGGQVGEIAVPHRLETGDILRCGGYVEYTTPEMLSHGIKTYAGTREALPAPLLPVLEMTVDVYGRLSYIPRDSIDDLKREDYQEEQKKTLAGFPPVHFIGVKEINGIEYPIYYAKIVETVGPPDQRFDFENTDFGTRYDGIYLPDEFANNLYTNGQTVEVERLVSKYELLKIAQALVADHALRNGEIEILSKYLTPEEVAIFTGESDGPLLDRTKIRVAKEAGTFQLACWAHYFFETKRELIFAMIVENNAGNFASKRGLKWSKLRHGEIRRNTPYYKVAKDYEKKNVVTPVAFDIVQISRSKLMETVKNIKAIEHTKQVHLDI